MRVIRAVAVLNRRAVASRQGVRYLGLGCRVAVDSAAPTLRWTSCQIAGRRHFSGSFPMLAAVSAAEAAYVSLADRLISLN